MGFLRDIAVRMKTGTEELNYGRHIIEAWGADEALSRAALGENNIRILDLGCGSGTDLLNVSREAESRGVSRHALELSGFEVHGPYREVCEAAGITTHAIDLEENIYPGEDASFDIVIANQILEHAKEVFWIMGEVGRLLKPGGKFIVGVPNLASLHNRFLLAAGHQPTVQQTLSAHVRGFTVPDFCSFAEKGGYFKVKDIKGSNFYPLPGALARPLARLFPGMAWGIFFLLERTERAGSFLECLYEDFLETNFYGGPLKPALLPHRRIAARRSAVRRSARH